MLAGVISILLVSGCFGLLAWYLRFQAVETAVGAMESAAATLSAHADGSLQALTSAQSGVLDELRRLGATTGARFTEVASTETMQRNLRDRISALPYVNALALIDSSGGLVSVSRVWPAPKLNFADRDYFAALRSSRPNGVFISAPVLNRVSGDWSVYVARRLEAGDKSFLGISLAAINPDYFHRFFATVAPDDATITLLRGDGRLVARYPGNDLADTPAARTLTAPLAGLAGKAAEPYDDGDGQARLVLVRRLPHIPLLIALSRTMEVTLAPWRRQACLLAVLAIVIDAAVGAFLLLAARCVWRNRLLSAGELLAFQAMSEREANTARERNAEAMRGRDRRMTALLERIGQGVCVFDQRHRLVLSNWRMARIFGLTASDCTAGRGLQGLCRASLNRGVVSIGDLRCLQLLCGRAELSMSRGSFHWELQNGTVVAVDIERADDDGWLVVFDEVPGLATAEISRRLPAEHRVAA